MNRAAGGDSCSLTVLACWSQEQAADAKFRRRLVGKYKHPANTKSYPRARALAKASKRERSAQKTMIQSAKVLVFSKVGSCCLQYSACGQKLKNCPYNTPPKPMKSRKSQDISPPPFRSTIDVQPLSTYACLEPGGTEVQAQASVLISPRALARLSPKSRGRK